MQYRQFEEALVRMLSVQDANLGAFRARLRHLRSLGVPNIPKRGSGNAVTYKLEDVFTTFVALALQTLGSNPTTSALIAKLTARHFERLGSNEEELFLVFTNMPDPEPENIGGLTTTPAGVQSMAWINNPLGGTIFAGVILGAAEAGRFVTSANTVVSSVINLSERFKALPPEM